MLQPNKAPLQAYRERARAAIAAEARYQARERRPAHTRAQLALGEALWFLLLSNGIQHMNGGSTGAEMVSGFKLHLISDTLRDGSPRHAVHVSYYDPSQDYAVVSKHLTAIAALFRRAMLPVLGRKGLTQCMFLRREVDLAVNIEITCPAADVVRQLRQNILK